MPARADDEQPLRPSEPRATSQPTREQVSAPAAGVTPARPGALGDVNLQVHHSSARRDEPGSESYLAAHSSFEGTIRAEEPVRIRGTVEGEVASTAAVLVEDAALVRASVSGGAVYILGEVHGQVRSEGRVELGPTARVTGEVYAGTLVLQEGAMVDGALHMGGAQARFTAEDRPAQR